MNVYLVQHGVATSKEENPERPLTEEGLADTARCAEYAVKVGVQVSRVVHSGKLRAKQTAEVFAEELQPRGGAVQEDGLEPKDDPNVWAGELSRVDKNIMLVGHLPHLSRLTSLLTCGDPDTTVVKFRNSGIVCLERAESGAWAIQWIVTPDTVA